MAEYYVGEIRLLAFTRYVPQDFLPCDGRTLNISDYEALYTLIGTTYGGDGRTNFALPDLRGRSPVNQGQTTPSGSNYPLAAKAGAESVTLTTANLPAHTHTVSVSNQAATTVTPGPTQTLASVGGNYLYTTQSQAGTVSTLAPDMVGQSNGGGQPHANVQPSVGLQYVIATIGIYPQFN